MEDTAQSKIIMNMTEEEYRKAKELFLQLMGETTEPKKKRRRRKKKQEEQIQNSKKGQ